MYICGTYVRFGPTHLQTVFVQTIGSCTFRCTFVLKIRQSRRILHAQRWAQEKRAPTARFQIDSKKKTLKAGQSWSVGHVDNPVWESLPSGVLKRVRKIPYK